MPLFDDALRSLRASLGEVRDSLAFLESATRLRPRLNGMLAWATLDPESRTLAQSFMKSKEFGTSYVCPGLLVQSTGAFEAFVRRMVVKAVQAINQKVPAFDDLKRQIAQQNILRTGHALATVLEPVSHEQLDHEQLGQRLGTCIRGSKAYTLNADVFALFLVNPSPAGLVEILRRIDFKLDWDDVGRISQVQTAVGTTGVRATAKAVQEKLERVFAARNHVAHRGSGGPVIDEQIVAHAADLLESLAAALAALVDAQLGAT